MNKVQNIPLYLFHAKRIDQPTQASCIAREILLTLMDARPQKPRSYERILVSVGTKISLQEPTQQIKSGLADLTKQGYIIKQGRAETAQYFIAEEFIHDTAVTIENHVQGGNNSPKADAHQIDTQKNLQVLFGVTAESIVSYAQAFQRESTKEALKALQKVPTLTYQKKEGLTHLTRQQVCKALEPLVEIGVVTMERSTRGHIRKEFTLDKSLLEAYRKTLATLTNTFEARKEGVKQDKVSSIVSSALAIDTMERKVTKLKKTYPDRIIQDSDPELHGPNLRPLLILTESDRAASEGELYQKYFDVLAPIEGKEKIHRASIYRAKKSGYYTLFYHHASRPKHPKIKQLKMKQALKQVKKQYPHRGARYLSPKKSGQPAGCIKIPLNIVPTQGEQPGQAFYERYFAPLKLRFAARKKAQARGYILLNPYHASKLLEQKGEEE